MTRQEKLDLIIQMRQEKKTYQEIADFFGITRKAVALYCIRRGLGYSEEEIKEAHKRGSRRYISEDRWKEKIKEKYGESVSFVSIADYKKGEAIVELKCNGCGTLFIVCASLLRKEKGITYQCSVCTEKKKKEEKVNKAIEKQGKAHRLAPKIKGQKSFNECKCGKFLLPGQGVCDQCKKKARRKQDRRKETKRRMRCKGGDWSISLEKLYERDKGICYLCGCLCNWDDCQWKDGVFIVGPTYPSVEHVVPLSKGGTHEWKNVKLACFICNSKKGARDMPLGVVV